MKRLTVVYLALALLLVLVLPGCQVIAGIFRAGMLAGLLFVVAVIVLIILLIRALVTG